MAITFGTVTITSPPSGTRQPCENGRFDLKITVTGTTDAAGGRYAIDIYQEEAGFDDKLDSVTADPIIGVGPFSAETRVTLKCDDDCYVAGDVESSGQADATIYALAREQSAPAADQKDSARITLHCGEADDAERRREERREGDRREGDRREGDRQQGDRRQGDRREEERRE